MPVEKYTLAPAYANDDPTETLAISLATVILPAVKFMVVAVPTSVPADWIPILLIPPPPDCATHDNPLPVELNTDEAEPTEPLLSAI